MKLQPLPDVSGIAVRQQPIGKDYPQPATRPQKLNASFQPQDFKRHRFSSLPEREVPKL